MHAFIPNRQGPMVIDLPLCSICLSLSLSLFLSLSRSPSLPPSLPPSPVSESHGNFYLSEPSWTVIGETIHYRSRGSERDCARVRADWHLWIGVTLRPVWVSAPASVPFSPAIAQDHCGWAIRQFVLWQNPTHSRERVNIFKANQAIWWVVFLPAGSENNNVWEKEVKNKSQVWKSGESGDVWRRKQGSVDSFLLKNAWNKMNCTCSRLLSSLFWDCDGEREREREREDERRREGKGEE